MELDQRQSLERILESAIVVSWEDLMRGAQTGLIHVEYSFAPDTTLDGLEVWSSITRGHWLLACEYWMSPSQSHAAGPCFNNGYKSGRLEQILQSVMHHQAAFSPPENRGRQGLLQISWPTQEETTKATMSVNQALSHAGSVQTI
jgi:hypothetical protein